MVAIRQRARFATRTTRLIGAFIAAAACLLAIGLPTTSASAADYTTRLNGGGQLNPGDSLWSPNHLYRLTQQSDGNLVEYSTPGNKPFWSSGTGNRPGSVTQFQTDGNLVVYAPGHVKAWASNSVGHPNSVLFMQNDANVVIYAPGNNAVWSTHAESVVGCTDGDRNQAEQYGGIYSVSNTVFTTTWTEPAPIGPSTDTLFFGVTLHYYAPHRCAWATGYGDTFSQVYIDRSTDGGKTWASGTRLGLKNFSGNDAYTGVFNDSYPYVIRACELGVEEIHCTPWF